MPTRQRLLQPYREVARVPGVASLLVWSLIGTLHLTGLVLALTFLSLSWTKELSAAGLITSCFTVGAALGGPLRGRSADRRSATEVLLVTTVVHATALTILALLSRSAWPLAPAIAFVAGLSKPPVAQLARAIWPRLAKGPSVERIYTVESTLQELAFVVGPVTIGALTAAAGPRFALGVVAGMALISAAGFARAVRRAGMDRPTAAIAANDDQPAGVPPNQPRAQWTHWWGERFGLLRHPRILSTLVLFVCLFGAMVTVNLIIIGWSYDRARPDLAGILAAAWAVSSLVGGLAAGGLTRGPSLGWSAAGMSVGILSLVAVMPPLNDASSWAVGGTLAISGLFMAPTVSASNTLLSKVAPQQQRAEAFGWADTSATVGAAISTPVCGWLIDTYGLAAGGIWATMLSVMGLCCVLAARACVTPHRAVP